MDFNFFPELVGYKGSICARDFGLIVESVSVQTEPCPYA